MFYYFIHFLWSRAICCIPSDFVYSKAMLIVSFAWFKCLSELQNLYNLSQASRIIVLKQISLGFTKKNRDAGRGSRSCGPHKCPVLQISDLTKLFIYIIFHRVLQMKGAIKYRLDDTAEAGEEAVWQSATPSREPLVITSWDLTLSKI
jgi:hypothetical protein